MKKQKGERGMINPLNYLAFFHLYGYHGFQVLAKVLDKSLSW
jgi:hypothetical protein